MLKREEFRLGEVVFNIETRDLRAADGVCVDLRNKSSEVLAVLASRPGEIVSKSTIMEAVWPDVTVSDESLTQCIGDIRKAIGDKDQSLVKTHVGKGYSLETGTPPQTRSAQRVVPILAALAFVFVLAIGAWSLWPEPEAASPPRIAVLAFDDLSAGEDQGYLSDGIAEGVITELSRYREFAVISRNSSFQFRANTADIEEIAGRLNADYIVEGSKQKSGKRLRVTVQLIDAHEDAHIWAHEFNSDIGEFFDVQSEVVRSIATTIGRELSWAPPQSGDRDKVSALHYYLRGNEEFERATPENILEVRALYLKSIEADPEAPFGYVGMALIYYMDVLQDWIGPDVSREQRIREGTEYAQKAIELDPSYYAAHVALADMHFVAGAHNEALARYQAAIELNPSSSTALVAMTDPLIYTNRADEAIANVKRAIELDPITPGWYWKSLAFAQWAEGRCAEGVESIKKKSRFRPWDLRHLATLQSCNGDSEEAQKTIAKLLEGEPEYTVKTYSDRVGDTWNNTELLERFLNDLRAAGLPEG